MQQELLNSEFFTFDFDMTPIRSYFARCRLEGADKTNQIIDEELNWLKLNSDPKAAFTIIPPPTSDQHWDQADEIVAAVVTIGGMPESRVKELFDDGQLERGLILDTIASALIDYCARQVYQNIEIIAKDKQLSMTGRITPGGNKGEIDFSYQKKLLELVDHAAIGVSITSGMMMKPVKSTSFLTLLGLDVETSQGCGHCSECPRLGTCEYRKFGIFSH